MIDPFFSDVPKFIVWIAKTEFFDDTFREIARIDLELLNMAIRLRVDKKSVADRW
jgi:hypothetical protein